MAFASPFVFPASVSVGRSTAFGALQKASSRLFTQLQGGLDLSQHTFRARHWYSSHVEVSQPRQSSEQTVIALDENWQPRIERGVDGALCIRELFCLARRFPGQIHNPVMLTSEHLPIIY